jgi:hypothetical protein
MAHGGSSSEAAEDVMTRAVSRLGLAALLSAGVAVAATTAALAQSSAPATSPAAPPAEHGAAQLPQHNCVLKTLSACGADGSCRKLDDLKGEKLPVKMTIDFALGIVAGVDPDGWVNATRIVSLARTQDQLILHGIDDAVAWQLLIYEKNQVMSFALASGDGASIGFGDCTVVKEQ